MTLENAGEHGVVRWATRAKQWPAVAAVIVLSSALGFVVSFSDSLKKLAGWFKTPPLLLALTKIEDHPTSSVAIVLVFKPLESGDLVQSLTTTFPSNVISTPARSAGIPLKVTVDETHLAAMGKLILVNAQRDAPAGAKAFVCEGFIPIGIQADLVIKGEHGTAQGVYALDYRAATNFLDLNFGPRVINARYLDQGSRFSSLQKTVDAFPGAQRCNYTP